MNENGYKIEWIAYMLLEVLIRGYIVQNFFLNTASGQDTVVK